MKKRWLIVLSVLVIIVVFAFGGWKMGLFDRLFPQKIEMMEEQPLEKMDEKDFIAEGRELLALVDTQEEAEEIASLYEIELVDFAEGVAVYTTDESPRDVVLRGKEAGYPNISINFVRQINN